ncbi:hypothetical protein SPI_04123 [Niveomyces insectorum RCEF 264]|uniref:Uncharacterized protein n=1 Tax=Niveomyces insectorum RCEF 264 TaxID=1081102 RepID=A0A167VGB3_9HYPO|nr:hypothetical protein SPI_04123 [Niveomyces insectorum RCEF 264]
MGLMTLITKKIKTEKQQKAQLRAPPYERKVTATSPVRLVQIVSSSNDNPRDATGSFGFSLRRPKSRIFSPFSSSETSSTGSEAPPPVVPTLHDDERLRRPTTAPSGRPQTKSRRESTLPALPLTASKSSTRLSQFVLPRPRASLPKLPKLETASHPPLPKHRPHKSFSSSRPSDSRKTGGGGGKGYVDLLDAQSEFRPADFHNRVQASGARNYGEDVADRNMGANGSNLDSFPVQTFYATNSGVPHRDTDRRRSFSSRDYPSSFNELDHRHGLHQRVTKQTSMDSGLWSKPLHTSRHSMYGGRTSSLTATSLASLQKQRLAQRQSFSGYSKTFSSLNLAEKDDGHAQQRSLHRADRDRQLQIAVEEANHFVSAWDTTSPESEESSPRAVAYSPPTLTRSLASFADIPRGSATLPKWDAVSKPRHVGDNSEVLQVAVNNQPILSPQPTSFRLSAAMTGSAFTASDRRPSTMHSMQPVRQLTQSSLASHNTMPDLSSLPSHLKEEAHNFKEKWRDDAPDRDSAASTCPSLLQAVLFFSMGFTVLSNVVLDTKTNRSRSQSRESVHDYPRTRSLLTPRPHTQSGETEEHQQNSLRHWSMTSTAPTTSSSSSGTYPRPHSRHTANTSVDLNTTTPSSVLSSSLVSVNSESSSRLPPKSPYSSKAKLKRSPTLQSLGFNIDDYVSSDDDSFVGPHQERGESEKDLLFDSGYGANGIQLPGLEDAFAAPSPVVMRRNPRWSASASRESLRQAYGDSPFTDVPRVRRKASDGGLSAKHSPGRRRSSSSTFELDVRSHQRDVESIDLAETVDGGNALTDNNPPKRSETMRMFALLGSSSPMAHPHQGVGTHSSNSRRYHPHPSHHQHLNFHHGSNVGEEIIEEEKLEKVDIATAIRLRKEAKARKRASLMTGASHTRGRSLAKPASLDGTKSGADEVASDGESRHRRGSKASTLARFAASPGLTDVLQLAKEADTPAV